MAEDDDYETLCREFEDVDGDGEEGSIMLNKDTVDAETSEIVSEIDKILEDSIDFRSKTILSKRANLSDNSKISILGTSQHSSFINITKEKDHTQTEESPKQDHISNTKEIHRKDNKLRREDNHKQNHILKVEENPIHSAIKQMNTQEVSDRNIGEKNKLRNEEYLNLSLLDKEAWEDDSDLQQLTVDDLFEEIELYEHLLDSDDEDECLVDSEEEKSTDHTVYEKISKTKEQDKFKQELKELKQSNVNEKYYNHLKQVWTRYEDKVGPIPHINAVVKPRIYRDKRTGTIIGFDSVEEYIDNNHPLWTEYREVFRTAIVQDKLTMGMTLANFIKDKWGGESQINIGHNFTCFPRSSVRGTSSVTEKRNLPDQREIQSTCKQVNVVTKGQESKVKNVKETLIQMINNAMEVGDLDENERNRQKHYEEALKNALQAAENLDKSEQDTNRVSSPPTLEEDTELSNNPLLNRKRKRVTDVKSTKKVTKADYVNRCLSEVKKVGVESTGRILFGVEENFHLHACYPESQLGACESEELASLEEVQSLFSKYYGGKKQDNERVCNQTEESTDIDWNELLEDY